MVIRPLETDYVRQTYHYVLEKHEDVSEKLKVAIYRQMEEDEELGKISKPHWEVRVIKLIEWPTNWKNDGLNGQPFTHLWSRPSAEQWGVLGWTFLTQQEANEKYENEIKRIKERNNQVCDSQADSK
jgi:hypothetical protein